MNKYNFNKLKLKTEWTLKKISWTKYFRVSSPYIFELYYNDSFIAEIFIREGFYTDFGSIPSILFFMDKTAYISYILHDFCYSLIWQVEINWKIRWISRREWDYILQLWLELEGMSNIQRNMVDLWLKIGGSYNYKELKPEIKSISKLVEK